MESAESSHVEQLLKRFEAVLALTRPDYLENLAPGLTQSELEALEQKLGLALPVAIRRFLQWRNGQVCQYSSALWYNLTLMDAELIVHFRRTLNELLAAGDFDEPNWWHPCWIPFAENGAGDCFAIDLAGCFSGIPGQVVRFWHDDPDRHIDWPSFEKWLETMVVAHERGYRNLQYGDVEFEGDEAILEDTHSELAPGYPIRTTADDGRGSRALSEIWGVNPELVFQVTDSSGFLALIDPDAYETFVGEDCTAASLEEHLHRQMTKWQLLLWGTGREDSWTLSVEQGITACAGFRSVVGPIGSVCGRLYLTTFEDLVRAASSRQVTFPEPHQKGRILNLPAGDYNCRIVQLHDPDAGGDGQGAERPHFQVEFHRGETLAPTWSRIPWSRGLG